MASCSGLWNWRAAWKTERQASLKSRVKCVIYEWDYCKMKVRCFRRMRQRLLMQRHVLNWHVSKMFRHFLKKTSLWIPISDVLLLWGLRKRLYSITRVSKKYGKKKSAAKMLACSRISLRRQNSLLTFVFTAPLVATSTIQQLNGSFVWNCFCLSAVLFALLRLTKWRLVGYTPPRGIYDTVQSCYLDLGLDCYH